MLFVGHEKVRRPPLLFARSLICFFQRCVSDQIDGWIDRLPTHELQNSSARLAKLAVKASS